MDRLVPSALVTGLAPATQRRLGAVVVGSTLAGVVLLVVADPERSLFLVALALGGLLAVALPHWAILAMFVLVTLRLSPVRLGPLSTAELIAAPLLVPLGLALLRDRGLRVLHVPHVRILVAIGGVLLAATGWSMLMLPPPPLEAMEAGWNEQIAHFRFLVILMFFVYFIRTRRHLGYAVATVIAMILVLAADGMVDAGSESKRAQAVTFGGFAGNENRLAFLCVWGTAFFWALAFKGPRGWWRPLTIVPLLGLPVAALMTGSRSGLMQLLLVGGLILLEQRQWSPAQRMHAFAMIVLAATLAITVVPSNMLGRASNPDVTGRTTIGRLHTLQVGAAMVLESPVFGVGPGNFVWRNQLESGHEMGTHNSYLWALTTGGPALLLLYVVLFRRTYRVLRSIERQGPGPFLWLATALRFNLITFLVFSWFANIWQSEAFWLLMGLTIALTETLRFDTRPARLVPMAATAGPARAAHATR